MTLSGLSDEQLDKLYEAVKAPGGLERLRLAFDALAPWFEGYLEGLRSVAIEVARAKLGVLEPDQEERIQKMRNWMSLRDLSVALAMAEDASTARALIEALPGFA